MDIPQKSRKEVIKVNKGDNNKLEKQESIKSGKFKKKDKIGRDSRFSQLNQGGWSTDTNPGNFLFSGSKD